MSDNPFSPGNQDLANELETLPDSVAASLYEWRKLTLDRERVEARMYLTFKNPTSGEKRTVGEVEALIHSDPQRYEIRLSEALAESNYTRLLERLYCAKKLSSLRTAY